MANGGVMSLLQSLNGGELVGVFALVSVFSVVFLVAVVSIIAGTCLHWKKTQVQADLKHRMLDAGMSAADIERVLHAGASSSKKCHSKS